MTTGRPLGSWNPDPAIRHEDRECPTHGLTPHAYWLQDSRTQRRAWRCIACQRDTTNARRALGIAPVPRPVKRDLASMPICSRCFMTLPATGVCDCD